MNKAYFTSESVTEGHPDKICDQISDMLLDEGMLKNSQVQMGCETFLAEQMILISGKLKPFIQLNIYDLVREKLSSFGFDDQQSGLDLNHLFLVDHLKRPKKDISENIKENNRKKKGAEDQGIYFGFACRETEVLMPLPIVLAHQLARQVDHIKRSKQFFLQPYGKTQVTVEYNNHQPVRVDTIVLALQVLSEKMTSHWKEELIEAVIKPVIPKNLFDQKTRCLIEPSERKTLLGLTGRKLTVDTYGGYARYGGGAFSGKDLSKMDRCAHYMARYIAKNVVAAGLADQCEIQLAYAVGYSKPISLNVETFHTNRIPEDKISQLIHQYFQLDAAALVHQMQLDPPQFQKTAVYGHFGRNDLGLPWEKTDKSNILRQNLNKN